MSKPTPRTIWRICYIADWLVFVCCLIAGVYSILAGENDIFIYFVLPLLVSVFIKDWLKEKAR